MRAYIINLDAAVDRWDFMVKALEPSGLPIVRIPAVNGRELSFPHPDYDEAGFHRIHGRTTNPSEVGCYLSHIKAMEAFLETGDSHGLICEDDIVLKPDFSQILTEALQYSARWNLLRLSGLSAGRPWSVASLSGGYQMCVCQGRLKGAGAYIVDRAAAAAFVEHLVPMRLPYDHAFDREWVFGLKAVYIQPFPALQDERLFRSSIQKTSGKYLAKSLRYATVYPYQAVNEISRFFYRTSHWLAWKLFGKPRPATGAKS